MKSFMKLLSVVLITTSAAFGADQQKPEDRQFQREQESKNRSALANATADQERKATQADLHRLQFAKEQETKRLQAKINAAKTQEENQKNRAGLKELLIHEKINGKEFNVEFIDRLPATIQTKIASMSHPRASYTNGYELLPAIMPYAWDTVLNDDFLNAQRAKIEFHVQGHFQEMGEQERYAVNYTVTRFKKIDGAITQTHDADFRNFFSLFPYGVERLAPWDISGKIINKTLYLNAGHARTMLDNCSFKQIELLRLIYQKANRQPHSPTNEIHLNKQESETYKTLSPEIRNILEMNLEKGIITSDLEHSWYPCLRRTHIKAFSKLLVFWSKVDEGVETTGRFVRRWSTPLAITAAAALTTWFMNQ